MPVEVTFSKDSLGFIYPTNQWQTVFLKQLKSEEFKVASDLFYIDAERKSEK